MFRPVLPWPQCNDHLDQLFSSKRSHLSSYRLIGKDICQDQLRPAWEKGTKVAHGRVLKSSQRKKSQVALETFKRLVQQINTQRNSPLQPENSSGTVHGQRVTYGLIPKCRGYWAGKPTELQHGCIYVLYDPISGHMKIGKTTDSATRRLQNVICYHGRGYAELMWVTHCNIDKSTLDRLEKLVHKDLKRYQREYRCTGVCPGRSPATHREWFKVSLADAQKTVEMWYRWLQVTPTDNPRILDSAVMACMDEYWTHTQRYRFWYEVLFNEDHLP